MPLERTPFEVFDASEQQHRVVRRPLELEPLEVAVQVNGKVRAQVMVPADASEADHEAVARADARVTAALDGQTVRKVVVVPGRIVNFVVG